MAEYLSPGVYIEEVNTGPRPIEGVGTACAAFVGFTPAGEPNTPTLVTNWSQFVNAFGAIEPGGRRNPYLPGAYLAYAVKGYFDNGGGRCYVTRVVPPGTVDDTPETLQLASAGTKAMNTLGLRAKGMQTSDIEIEVAPALATGDPAPIEGSYILKVHMAGAPEETFTITPPSTRSRGVAYATETINRTSTLIEVIEEKTTGTPTDRMPEIGKFILKAPSAEPDKLPNVKASDFEGDVTERSGITGLEIGEDVTMVCCPDLMALHKAGVMNDDDVKAVQVAMLTHCAKMGDRIAILDPLPGLKPQDVKKWREQTNYDSMFAALYYPWLKVMGIDGVPIAVPPCGHMAGIYARSDQQRGVHKAPANEDIRGVLDVARALTKGEQDTLNPIGVNCLRSFAGRGIRVWGARTLSSDPAWRYINVRRLFNYVEKSIERGTQWVVFEPNDQDLWARVRRDVTAFLLGTWRDGALFGAAPDQAFFVKCDEETNPPDVRDRGQLVIEIGMAPVKPAEFVIFRFSQFAGGGQ